MSGPGGAVTVVVPVWDDYVRYLPDAVESVRRNGPDVPIVVVENASSTALPELKGCQIVHASTRLTAGAARNLGLERVESEFVVFLDADDMILSGTLEYLHDRIATDRELSIASTGILDGETRERHRGPRGFVPALARLPRILALADCVWSLVPIQGCAILRADQVRDAGGYADADSGEDWALAASLLWRGRASVSSRFGLLYRAPHDALRRRPRTSAELRASARRIRRRIRRDPLVPRLARAFLPAIAALQLAAIYVVRPIYRITRRLIERARPNKR
jgi:glycosyltransferase involved in cell wall biosynthesis